MGGAPDIPKCDLPARKKPARAASPKAKGKAKDPPAASEWDAAEEARKAREAVAAKSRKKGLIEAPEGAVVIPGVSKRKRVKPEAPPVEETREPRKERTARLREEAKALEDSAAERARRILDEAKARDRVPMTDELFFEMLVLVAGGMTLRQICRMPGMPSRTTFHVYVNCEDQSLAALRSERLARARALGLETIAEAVIDIVDDGSNDWIEREKDGATLVELDREHISRSKLRAEMRLKLLAVWEPTRYGARLTHSDADGQPLRGSGMTASDLAIGLAKLVEAAKRNDLALQPAGVIIDQDPAA